MLILLSLLMKQFIFLEVYTMVHMNKNQESDYQAMHESEHKSQAVQHLDSFGTLFVYPDKESALAAFEGRIGFPILPTHTEKDNE